MLTPCQMRRPIFDKKNIMGIFEIKDGLKIEEASDERCLLEEWK